MEQNISDIIEKLGGLAKAAQLIGVPKTTVFAWKKNDRVPDWRWAELERVCAEAGLAALVRSDRPAKKEVV